MVWRSKQAAKLVSQTNPELFKTIKSMDHVLWAHNMLHDMAELGLSVPWNGLDAETIRLVSLMRQAMKDSEPRMPKPGNKKGGNRGR